MKRKRFRKLERAHAARFTPPGLRNQEFKAIRDFRIMPGRNLTYQAVWDQIMEICDGDSRGVGVKRK